MKTTGDTVLLICSATLFILVQSLQSRRQAYRASRGIQFFSFIHEKNDPKMNFAFLTNGPVVLSDLANLCWLL
jgi:hypothetical protein